MLTKIAKIKNLGVFSDFAATADTPSFGRYNVIYGENGSGKTTLSRLLKILESGSHPDYPDLQYTVDAEAGALTQSTKCPRKVRVFNSDYVQANIGLVDGPLKHILIVGEENKALAEELEKEKATRDGRVARLQTISDATTKARDAKGRIFTRVASTIGQATSGTSMRSYRKPDAERAFANLADDAKPLSEAELEVHRATIGQAEKPALTLVALPSSEGETEGWLVGVVQDAGKRLADLCQRTGQARVIERLRENPTLAHWIETGLHLHKGGRGRCEFCDQPLPERRIEELAMHFSAEDQALKDAIEAEMALVTKVTEGLREISLPDSARLYSELVAEYDTLAAAFLKVRNQLCDQLNQVHEMLAAKLVRRTEAYSSDLAAEINPTLESLRALNELLERHNTKTANFESEKATAQKLLEAHYLLEIKAEVSELTQQEQALAKEELLLNQGGEGLPDPRGLIALSQSIADKQAKVSSAHMGGEHLTKRLKQFLGRTELTFESTAEGYLVLRRGTHAKRLSEGERTAIAFLYFLVQLTDQDFQISDGIVVIDDPISSLDASAIYQAFSYLKNDAGEAKQLFLLTHNFDFLRLLINWIDNIPKLPAAQKSFAMVVCSETVGGRSAKLVKLDKLLIEHPTEYCFLFKTLHSFKSDGTIMSCYHVPNMARKVLETFLDFHVPSKKNLYQKLDQVTFDPHKKTAIYKFANDLSHHTGKSFDPAIVAETQKNTEYLLQMIESVAPQHFAGQVAMCQP